MQSDAIKPGQSVIIVDDLIATGMYIWSTLPYAVLTATLSRWLCQGSW